MAALTEVNKAIKKHRVSSRTKVWMQHCGPHIGLYYFNQKLKKIKWIMWLQKSHANALKQAGVKLKKGK